MISRIRTVVADDEPLARRGIRAHLDLEKDFEVVAECRNGREAVAVIEADSPDLVFLDVQMPELDGFGVVEAVGVERMPVVIFVTAYDRHALRAFEVNALDYLLKPFDSERFSQALQRARTRLERDNVADLSSRLQSLLTNLERPNQNRPHRLVIKSAGRLSFVDVDEIDWVEAADNYVRLHTGKESRLLRETMNSLEKRLDPDKFLRIHRSRIVNRQKVKELRPLFRGEYDITLQDGTRLETGRGYREQVQKLLNDA